MKKILLFAALFFPLTLSAQMLQADSAYDKENFTEALKQYKQIAQSARGEDLYKAQLRIIASQYMLGQYMNAAKTAFTTPLPSDSLWKARFLLYRIASAKQVSQIYRAVLANADEENGEFENLSPAQWTDKINESFDSLWSLRKALIYAPLQQETLILDIKEADLQAVPTLFDFVVLQLKKQLLEKSPATPLPAEEILAKKPNFPQTNSYDVQKLLTVLAQAAQLGGVNRADARLIWQTDLLTIPFTQARFFSFTDKTKQRTQTIQKLEELSGYADNKKTGFLDKINQALLKSSKTDYGRSYAALQAAHMLNEDEDFAEAAALCDWTVHNLSKNYYSQSCAQLATEIRAPFIHMKAPAANQNPAHTEISFTARNAQQVYVRLYKISEKDLKDWNKETEEPNSWSYLTHIDSDQIPQLLARSPLYTSFKKISYSKPHAQKKDTLLLPPLTTRGFYALALSYEPDFNVKQAPVSVVILNNSDLALFVSTAIEDNPENYHFFAKQTQTPQVFRIYTLNLQTGEPEPQTAVNYFFGWGNKKKGQTDANGILSLPFEIHPNKSNSYSIWPRADKADSTALTRNYIYFHFTAPEPFKLYAETDRAIYRPGQTVQIAAYGFQEAGRGFKTMPAHTPLQLTVRDANYEKILVQTLSLNDYGTAQTQVVLPQTGLLGRYTVELSYQTQKRTFRGRTSFKVEEYKRPEYEVKLNPSAVLQFDKEARITGHADYYFGAPVEQAEVQYTVTRRQYHPPFWWWRVWQEDQTKQIAQGKTKTAKDGSFEIPFTPQADADKTAPYLFEVKVSVLDASGRAIDATQNYKISEKNMFFSVSFDKGFYDANTPSVLGHVQLLDITGQPVSGKFTAEIEQLENTYPTEEKETANQLEAWFGKNTVIRHISQQTLASQNNQSVTLQIPALPEGIYKLKLTAKNAETAELIFLVAHTRSNLALPAVAIVQQKDYFPNTQAKILIGAGKLNGPKRIEIYDKGKFLALTDRIEKGVTVYTLPIRSDWRGGIYLRWFGASDYKLYTSDTFINIPFDNKELSLSADIPAVVKPGQKTAWPIRIKNATGAPVNAQAAVRVYDKSLDYYAQIQPAFTLDNLYHKAPLNVVLEDSDTTSFPQEWFTGDNPYHLIEPPTLPSLNLDMRFGRYFADYAMAEGSLGSVRSAGIAMQKSAVRNTKAAMAPITVLAGSADSLAEKEESTETTDSPRSDFSETAYFNPMLPLAGGKGTLSFTMPQSLTAWKIQALAFTQDANIGSFAAQTITQKDIMVRLSLPRFWREGDHSSLIAQVTNVTNQKITAEVSIDVLENAKDVTTVFGIDKKSQIITIPAHANTAVTWPVHIPQGVGLATITATVRAGKDSDSESRELPLLPAQERLAESTTVALESGSQILKLENLLIPDQTRQVSQISLRVDPGLFLSVLNTMPQLLRPSYNDALSQVNRYVPLAVVNAFYKTYPVLQQAVGHLPKRNTQTPAWENTDPARLMLLEETPWLQTARGGASREAFLTDLFNPAAVEKARAQSEKMLAKYQTTSGGFSWLPGGEPSEFITLRILAAYAHILRYGGEIPQDSAQKALAWLAPRIEKNLKESNPSVAAVSYALYSAYVFTAYPQTWKTVKSAPVKKWLDYADEHSRYMTPLGQTYAASAYYRLGDNTKAQNYVDLLLSQIKSDPVTGAYFAPEAQSWLWYNDTLTTQTAVLHTLLEIRPESDKAADLIKWLLFNRKAQVWRDTTAAAQTVYCLLDYMQRRGLLDDPSQYALQWGQQHITLNLQPFDWNGKLTWTQQAENVNPQYYTAQVTKRGGMTGFVTLDAVYTTAHATASQPGVLNISRRYLLKYNENGRAKARPLSPEEEIPVGAEVEVQLTLTASSAFDFVLLTDPKPAGFENTALTSGWTWDALSYYREIRDGQTNFFFDRIAAGTYTLRYTLRPTLAGNYHVLPAQVQSMYAPEFSAHTASDEMKVK